MIPASATLSLATAGPVEVGQVHDCDLAPIDWARVNVRVGACLCSKYRSEGSMPVETSRPLIQRYIGRTTRSDPFGSATRFHWMTAKNLGPPDSRSISSRAHSRESVLQLHGGHGSNRRRRRRRSCSYRTIFYLHDQQQ
jgi:hypothetical protein